MRSRRSAASALATTSFAAALAIAGCGESRDYPEGFAEAAALDEEGYKALEAEKALEAAKAKEAAKPAAPARAASAGSTESGASPDSGAASSIAEASGSDGVDAAAPAGNELFEPDGITPSDAGRKAVQSVATELSLPAPAPVAEAPGDEPYQKLARDRKFDEFRRKAARYVQLKRELLPLGRKMSDGTATPAERALHNRIEDAIAVEFKPLNRYLWDERWSESDRAAMGWILFVTPD
jgi:hypothetical protein